MERIKAEILVEMTFQEEGLWDASYAPDAVLKEIYIDSLDLVQVAMNLEDKLNIDEIPSNELEKLVTVEDIIQLVMKYDFRTKKPPVQI
jgi:acyl carrier protein